MNGLATVGLLAAGDDQQKAAPLGLFVLVLLGVVCYFLFRSMSRHLRRVRDDFPADTSPLPSVPPPAAPEAAAPTQVEDRAVRGPAGTGTAGLDGATDTDAGRST